jgi:hypothetical protein
MTNDSNLEDLLRSLDPLNEELHRENAQHADGVWAQVVTQVTPRTRRSRRRVIALSSLATVGAATALVIGLLPGSTPVNAAASTLHRAALDDATAAALPILASGQFYYQETRITLTCTFAGMEGTTWGPWVTYDADATMQSWTSPNSLGQSDIAGTPIDQDGSHFATATDEANWVAEGKPFVPCAFQGPPVLPSNSTSGTSPSMQPVPAESESIEGFDGFGFMLPAQAGTAAPTIGLEGGMNSQMLANALLALPDSVSQIQAMLANGEINPDGSVSSTPQACPMDAAPNAAPGCDNAQQLTMIEQLLRWPEASAKLGSVLYQVLEQMPGATVATDTTDSFGDSGTTLTVPVDGSSDANGQFQVLIDPATGALLSSTELNSIASDATSDAYSPAAALSYGPVSVVNGVGTLPTSST